MQVYEVEDVDVKVEGRKEMLKRKVQFRFNVILELI
jgi:hypothetical protein